MSMTPERLREWANRIETTGPIIDDSAAQADRISFCDWLRAQAKAMEADTAMKRWEEWLAGEGTWWQGPKTPNECATEGIRLALEAAKECGVLIPTSVTVHKPWPLSDPTVIDGLYRINPGALEGDRDG